MREILIWFLSIVFFLVPVNCFATLSMPYKYARNLPVCNAMLEEGGSFDCNINSFMFGANYFTSVVDQAGIRGKTHLALSSTWPVMGAIEQSLYTTEQFSWYLGTSYHSTEFKIHLQLVSLNVADTNGDGQVSESEFNASPSYIYDDAVASDGNGNVTITVTGLSSYGDVDVGGSDTYSIAWRARLITGTKTSPTDSSGWFYSGPADYLSITNQYGQVTPRVTYATAGLAFPSYLLGTDGDTAYVYVEDVKAKIQFATPYTIYYRVAYSTNSSLSDVSYAPSASGTINSSEVVRTTLSDLTKGTKYYYRIEHKLTAEDSWNTTDKIKTFKTVPEHNVPFRIAVHADGHYLTYTTRKLSNTTKNDFIRYTRNAVITSGADVFIDLGDFLSIDSPLFHTAREYDAQFMQQAFIIQSLGIPIYWVKGNHERDAGVRNETWDNMCGEGSDQNCSFVAVKKYQMWPTNGEEGRYGSISYGDALFVFLDPYPYSPEVPLNPSASTIRWSLGSSQVQWLRNVLENATEKYVFIFSHQTLAGDCMDYPVPDYFDKGMGGKLLFYNEGANFQEIYKHIDNKQKYFFFFGHDHLYARESLGNLTFYTVPSPTNIRSFSEPGYSTGDCFPYCGHTLYGGFSDDPCNAMLNNCRSENYGIMMIDVNPSYVKVWVADAETGAVDTDFPETVHTFAPSSTTTLPATTSIELTTTTSVPLTVLLIQLASFTAVPLNNSVHVQWTTASEINNVGFNLYRAESENGQYIKINALLIPAQGTSAQGASYEFIDINVRNRKTYYYKLEDIDLSDKSTMHGTVSATPRWIFGIFGFGK